MRNKGAFIFLLVVAAVMYAFNRATPLMLSDDMVYECVWTEDEAARPRPVRTLHDVVESQRAHYMMLNGRAVVHTVAQTFLGIVGKDIFNVFNALMFSLLLWLCMRFAVCGGVTASGDCRSDEGGDVRLPVMALAAFLLFIVMAGFRDGCLWFMGSFNYLWTAVAVLLFLCWFYRAGERPFTIGSLWVCPLALLAGWTHEGLTLPLSFGFFLWVLAGRRTAFRSAAFPSVLCFFVGTALCVFAPGTFQRASASEVSLPMRAFLGAYNMVFFVRVLWLWLLMVIVAWRYRRDVLVMEFRRHYVLYAAMLAAYSIVAVCAQTEARVCFHAEFLALLLLLSLLVRLNPVRAWRPVAVAACAVMAAVAIAVMPFAVANARNYGHLMAQQRDPDAQLVRVRQLQKTRSVAFNGLIGRYVMQPVVFGFNSCYQGFNADENNMRCAASVYGKPEVIYLPEDLAEHFAAGDIPMRCPLSDRYGDIAVVRLTAGAQVRAVRFLLKPECMEDLPLRKRLLAYREDTYSLPENKFKAVQRDGRTYLFFCWPLSNVRRRIGRIQVVVRPD